VHDETYMRIALDEAENAGRSGEVPIGAVLVRGKRVIARNHNRCIELNDPTAHAEMLVLREAGRSLNNYRLTDTVLYVTAEPCPMCASAMIHGRIARLVFGVLEPKFGAVQSKMTFFESNRFYHSVEVNGGILAQDCAEPLKRFFREKRNEHRRSKLPTV
jgi:tRNA(adenine34) deaminase